MQTCSVICHSAFDSKFERKRADMPERSRAKNRQRNFNLSSRRRVCQKTCGGAAFEKRGDSRSANLFVAGNGTGVTEDWSDKGIVDQ